MSSDEQERPNLHIAREKREELFGLLKQADALLRKASNLSTQLMKDENLCPNCRLDATQEETVVNCAGFLLENLKKKISRELSGEMLQDLLRGEPLQ